MEKSIQTSTKHRRAEQTTNDECKFDALKNLDILHLYNAVQKNANCSKVATEVFQQNFTGKYFVVDNIYPDAYSSGSSEVLFFNLQTGIKMINHFGHLIQKKKSYQLYFIKIKINHNANHHKWTRF